MASASRAPRWLTLTTVSITQLMVVMNLTIIAVALPSAQRALHFSSGDREWLLTAYVVAFGSLLLVGGRLSDRWGPRRTLVLGLGGFALASALGGVAESYGLLVGARAAQGLFGALLAPAALATLSVTFVDPQQRAKAFALFGALTGSGAALGLVLGGALTQWQSWRWCLEVNLVFAALAMLGVVRGVARGAPRPAARADVVALAVVTGGLFCVLAGLSRAADSSGSGRTTGAALVIGAGLVAGFVAWQVRARSPLVARRLLVNRTRAGSLVALFISSVGLVGISLLLAYYLQGTLGYSPLRTGVAFVPMVGALGLSASVVSARLLAQVGPRPIVPAGMVLATLGLILFTKLTVHPDYLGNVLPGLIVSGLGLGLILAPAMASATAGTARADAGAAAALVNVAQIGGAALGAALLNTIATAVSLRALHAQPTAAVMARVWSARATVHGYAVAFWWAAGIVGVGAILSFVVLESGVNEFADERVASP